MWLPIIFRPSRKSSARLSIYHILGLASGADDNALVERLKQFVDDLGLPTTLGELDASLVTVAWELVAQMTA